MNRHDRGRVGVSRVRGATVASGALGALAAAPLFGGCATRTTVPGSYAEVWDRSQAAVAAVRFQAAHGDAMNQRIERDEQAGVIKYIWTGGGRSFNNARVVTLRIDPTEDTNERLVTIEAWTWAFFGFIPAADFSTAELVRHSIEKEFSSPPEERPAASVGITPFTTPAAVDGSIHGGS